MSETPLLEIKDLCVSFPTEDGVVSAVDGVSLSLSRSESVGIVGESGSGKSVTWLTVMGLTDRTRANISGQVLFEGNDLLALPEDELQAIRGQRISMIFQDPMTSLHPYYKVGSQIAEAVRTHKQVSKKEAWDRAVEMLKLVSIPQPERRAQQFPHEFSGGMRQRAMIAMALALDPAVLIADEPTTALDVTVQAQILELIGRIREELGTAVVTITHDLGVVAEYCERIGVMYAGRMVEHGSARDLYYDAQHPYTWGLLRSISRLDDEAGSRLTPIKGLPPSLINVPPGCAFHPRCPYAFDRCRVETPILSAADGIHSAACHLSIEDRHRIFAEEVKR